MNITLLKIEICDVVLHYFTNKRKLKIIDIFNVLQRKYPIKHTQTLHKNIKQAIKAIFAIHINRKKNTKVFRCSRKHAIGYISNNNIIIANGSDYF
jgi:hypothetical protein